MRLELKPFQEKALEQLLGEVLMAQSELELRAKHQALVLSSPTGSGKTITLAAMIESIFEGRPGVYEERPEATFLWFSNSPELNEQSRDKLLRSSESLLLQRLEVIDSGFDQEILDPGMVYFLNHQKLAVNSTLVNKGDDRHYTIWETLRNTIERCPSDLIFIIDEAHHGMQSRSAEREAATIVQRFIVGDHPALLVEAVKYRGQLLSIIGQVVGLQGLGDHLHHLRQQQHPAD